MRQDLQPDKLYHGNRAHEFVVYPKVRDELTNPKANNSHFLTWDSQVETLVDAHAFCSNCIKKRPGHKDSWAWQCQGHEPLTGDAYKRECDYEYKYDYEHYYSCEYVYD